jgi:hypothetical protein
MGQLTSFLGTDVNHLEVALTSFHQLWIAPVQLIIAISIIYQYLGLTSFLGIGVFLFVIFLQGTYIMFILRHKNKRKCRCLSCIQHLCVLPGCMGILYQHFSSYQVKDQDKRLGIISQLIQDIRLIKMYTWEPLFQEMADDARK